MACVKYTENGINVEYYPQFYNALECEPFMMDLETLPYWKPLTYNVHGKDVTTRRKVCAFGDVNYIFSGQDIPSHPWYDYVKEIKTDVERLLDCEFNHALINYYPDGNSKINPHKDNEACLDSTSPIAVVSFGATRTLQFMRSGYPTTSVPIEHGSLYVMYPPTNQLFTHGIPAEPEVKTGRYSITFRHVLNEEPLAKKFKMSESSPDLLSDLVTRTLMTDIPPLVMDIPTVPIPTVSMDITPSVDITTDFLPVKNFEASTDLTMDDTIPSIYWLERYIQIPSQKEICSWNLYWGTHLFLVADKKSVRIHIRDYTENKHGQLFPTKKGVTMTPATWSELCVKIHHHLESRTSAIFNNQLGFFCVDDDYCVLQQIFKDNEAFTLKPTYCKIGTDQAYKIVEYSHAITQCMEEYLFSNLVVQPILARSCQEIDHITEDESLKYYIDCFKSQCQDLFTHMGSHYETFSKSHVFLNVNYNMLVQKLCHHQCTCHYTSNFFQVNSLDMLYKELYSMVQ